MSSGRSESGNPRTIIEHAGIACVDAAGTEHAEGHVVIEQGRIVEIGPDPAPRHRHDEGAQRIDGRGCLLTPGLVNTHHHLYQWATRGYAQQQPLFGWLSELYPVWAGLDAEITHAAASAGLAHLALSGASTVADHHYVYPRGGGDVLAGLVAAGERIGVRLHAVRGSMDRGRSQGGLPPDSLVEDRTAALEGTSEAIARYHDPAPDALLRIAVGPCSPFSVSPELMRGAAELARAQGVRLHTHLAETVEEDQQCRAEFGRTPVEYAEELGWLGVDVWLAHAVHLDTAAVRRIGASGTAVAHCPSSNGRLGTGIARVRDLLDAGVTVGLGVDGSASNESAGMVEELHQALLSARLRDGAAALTARDSLTLATVGGARCLGREQEIGSIEVGKLADLALWRMDGLGWAGMTDLVAGLVFGPRPPLERLLVGGRTVVSGGALCTAEESELAAALRVASRGLERANG
ncbi:MAG: 8-oxoguanine deaminase [Sciscionella sp.]